jgi:hypothetical protein
VLNYSLGINFNRVVVHGHSKGSVVQACTSGVQTIGSALVLQVRFQIVFAVSQLTEI